MAISLKDVFPRRGEEPEEHRELVYNPLAFGDVFLDAEVSTVLHSNSILSIPPAWAAVDFLCGTLAALPLHVHREGDYTEILDGREADFLGRSPSPGYTSYDWRYALWKNVFTRGRSICYIERNPSSGRLRRLHWEFEPSEVEVVREEGKLLYKYKGKNGDTKIWEAKDVIDVAWMRAVDGLGHISPVQAHVKVFEMAIAFEQYQRRFADTGGVPPYVLKARWNSPTAVKDGIREFLTSVRLAKKNKDPFVPIGKDMEVDALGATPEQGRVLETQQFIVRQFSRIYGVPPIYLHDLDRMTFSNAEHQALNLLKYTVARWATQLEEQLSLKVLGPGRVARHDVDDLLRGDYKTRVEGHSTAIFSGQLTPNEARRTEGRPPLPNGDDLFIQSGTQPIDIIRDQANAQIEAARNPQGGDQGDSDGDDSSD